MFLYVTLKHLTTSQTEGTAKIFLCRRQKSAGRTRRLRTEAKGKDGAHGLNATDI